jgi:hypothetical protein
MRPIAQDPCHGRKTHVATPGSLRAQHWHSFYKLISRRAPPRIVSAVAGLEALVDGVGSLGNAEASALPAVSRPAMTSMMRFIYVWIPPSEHTSLASKPSPAGVLGFHGPARAPLGRAAQSRWIVVCELWRAGRYEPRPTTQPSHKIWVVLKKPSRTAPKPVLEQCNTASGRDLPQNMPCRAVGRGRRLHLRRDRSVKSTSGTRTSGVRHAGASASLKLVACTSIVPRDTLKKALCGFSAVSRSRTIV